MSSDGHYGYKMSVNQNLLDYDIIPHRFSTSIFSAVYIFLSIYNTVNFKSLKLLAGGEFARYLG